MLSKCGTLIAIAALTVLIGITAPILTSAPLAVDLPSHCNDLLDGDCDQPLRCLALCFMELAGLYDFCERFPNDPRCM